MAKLTSSMTRIRGRRPLAVSDELHVPKTPDALVARLLELEQMPVEQHSHNRVEPHGRKCLSVSGREVVLRKTDRRCHICGGLIDGRWEADHILAHSGNGQHSTENLLPAHRLCNNYRWDYLPDEFQWILKMGVWARHLMAKSSSRGNGLGRILVERFFNYEQNRLSRGGKKAAPARGGMSAAGRRKLSAMMKARWAARKAGEGVTPLTAC